MTPRYTTRTTAWLYLKLAFQIRSNAHEAGLAACPGSSFCNASKKQPWNNKSHLRDIESLGEREEVICCEERTHCQHVSCSNTLFLPLAYRFLPTLVALAVLSRIPQRHRLPLWTLHHVQQPLSQVGVSWQVSIHLRVQPRWWDHAGGLGISLCDLLLHQSLRRGRAYSSSGGLPVHKPLSAATARARARPRPGEAASAPGKAVVNIWAVRPAGEAAPLPSSSLPPSLRLPLFPFALSLNYSPVKKKEKHSSRWGDEEGGLIRDRLRRARECAEPKEKKNTEKGVRTETVGLWWQMRSLQEPLRDLSGFCWRLCRSPQGSPGNCGHATCVRHRLEQLRTFGARTLLDVQSRVTRTFLRAARRQGDRSGWFLVS